MIRLAVVVGGVAGTALRMGAGTERWPTFVVNVVGAGVLGYLVTRLVGPRSVALAFLGVGVLGAMTTFSTLAVQVWDSADVGYGVASVAAGYVAAAVGARAASS